MISGDTLNQTENTVFLMIHTQNLPQTVQESSTCKHLAAHYHPLHHQSNHSTALFDVKHKGLLDHNL